MLSSFAERNQFNASWPFTMGNAFNGFTGRRYWPDGDDLEILPVANSAGNYKLIYTPQQERLALPVTKTFDFGTSDIPEVPPPGLVGGTGAWLFANGGLTADVPTTGFDLTLTFDTPNEGFNGTYHVVDTQLPPVFSIFGVSNLASTAGFTPPPTGTGTYTYQPVGTIGELPDVLTPWTKYIQLKAAIAIRSGRRQPIGPLDAQFQREEKKLIAITKQRGHGVMQAPITNTNWGGGYGFGWNGSG